MLKTRECDLWSMRIEQYLTYTDYALWEVIMNGDAPAIASASVEGPIPPKTAEERLDAKSLWEAIKTRFGGNKESKKMQKIILKQQYENFTASKSEGLDKTYDRFQKLISQLEILGEVISLKDANLKFLRSLPTAWNTHTLIMRNKADLDTLSMDDLYNNFKVYEAEIKVQSSSNSNSQIVAFVSLENTSSTNEAVNTAHDVSAASSSSSSSLDTEKEQLNKANLEIIGYKLGLKSLEARIIIHQKNEAVFKEDIAFLKYDVQVRDMSIKDLKNQLEEALKEKDDLKLKLEKFEESSKNLTKLINNQINAKYKTRLGYDSQMNESEVFNGVFTSRESNMDDNTVNDRFKIGKGLYIVPPPYTGNFMPPRPDLSFAGLDDYVFRSTMSETVTSVHETETSASKTSKERMEEPKTVRSSAPLIEEWESDSDDDCVIRPLIKQIKLKFINFVKSGENVKFVNKENIHRQAESPRKSQSPKVLTKSRNVPVNTAKQSFPRAAILNSTARYINTAASRPVVNGAKPSSNVFHKAHSPVRRPFNQKSAAKTNNFKEKVNTASIKVNTARVNNVTTARPKAVVSAAKRNRDNVGNPQYALQDQGIFYSGCSRHLTGNKFYLSDYQDIDSGFVAFGGNAKRGKIIRKGKISTGKLDFQDVYFVKELKFNLFSVSQMCDKKNSVLFTKIECLVLSPDFKLLDESQFLLKVPRQNNMYSFDLKNVVPLGDLTCLFVKATIDESNLWHRRLGHINFKTMNKLVRGNLVRGLPLKLFENDYSCVAFLEEKETQSLLALAFIDERLAFYKNNEVIFTDKIVVLKSDASFNEAEIIALKGLGYNVVPHPLTGLFSPPSIDLSHSGIEKFKEPEFEGYGLRANKSVYENSSNETKKNSDAPLIEEWVFDNENEVESPVVVEKKTVVPTIPKVNVDRPKQQENPVRKTVKYAEMYRS
ncbi:ribonuclease H-like domain-containing protein [Tanacetum coccineum]